MRGTVAFIDDGGTLHMKWDNGRTLGLIIGEDRFKVVSRTDGGEPLPRIGDIGQQP